MDGCGEVGGNISLLLYLNGRKWKFDEWGEDRFGLEVAIGCEG